MKSEIGNLLLMILIPSSFLVGVLLVYGNLATNYGIDIEDSKLVQTFSIINETSSQTEQMADDVKTAVFREEGSNDIIGVMKRSLGGIGKLILFVPKLMYKMIFEMGSIIGMPSILTGTFMTIFIIYIIVILWNAVKGED